MEDALLIIMASVMVLVMGTLAFTGLYVAGWLLWGALKDAYRYFMEN